MKLTQRLKISSWERKLVGILTSYRLCDLGKPFVLFCFVVVIREDNETHLIEYCVGYMSKYI